MGWLYIVPVSDMPVKYGTGVLLLVTNNEEHRGRPVVVDNTTGELLSDRYVIVSIAQREAYKARLAREEAQSTQLSNTRFVASYHEPIKSAIKRLTLVEAGALMRLLPYIKWKSDGLVTLDGEQIAELLDRSRKRTNITLKTLCDVGVLDRRKGEGRYGRYTYYVNPTYHTFGVSPPKHAQFTKLFRNHADDVLAKVSLETAGFLYKLQPYIHREKCLLTASPDNPQAKAATIEQLAELTGTSKREVAKHLLNLRQKHVIIRATTFGKGAYFIHPELMFRLPSDIDESLAVRDMFNSVTEGDEFYD